MKVLILLFTVVNLLFSCVANATSLYDVKFVNEYTENTERNKDRIEKILYKLAEAADIKERIMIDWTDAYRDSTWGCAVTPDFFNG